MVAKLTEASDGVKTAMSACRDTMMRASVEMSMAPGRVLAGWNNGYAGGAGEGSSNLVSTVLTVAGISAVIGIIVVAWKTVGNSIANQVNGAV